MTEKPKKTKIKPVAPLPLPVDIIFAHRPLIVMRGGPFRAIVAMALAYWQADCPDMSALQGGIDFDALFTAARMETNQRAALMPVLAPHLRAILPALAQAHAYATHTRARASAAARAASEIGREKRFARLEVWRKTQQALKKKDAAKLIDASAQSPVTPQTARTYNNQAAALAPHELAKIGRQPTPQSTDIMTPTRHNAATPQQPKQPQAQQGVARFVDE